MTDGYVFAEEYTLPSMGKVYDVKVNPVVRLKSMNTEHEMKRLSPSERPYKTLCEIIDDCLVDNPGISSYDMCMADYIFLLHKLRVATYGKTYEIEANSPEEAEEILRDMICNGEENAPEECENSWCDNVQEIN